MDRNLVFVGVQAYIQRESLFAHIALCTREAHFRKSRPRYLGQISEDPPGRTPRLAVLRNKDDSYIYMPTACHISCNLHTGYLSYVRVATTKPREGARNQEIFIQAVGGCSRSVCSRRLHQDAVDSLPVQGSVWPLDIGTIFPMFTALGAIYPL